MLIDVLIRIVEREADRVIALIETLHSRGWENEFKWQFVTYATLDLNLDANPIDV